MEVGFPDMSMVIDIVFFLLIAIFMIVVAKMIMGGTEPKVVVSIVFSPMSYLAYPASFLRVSRRKKGLGLMIMIVLFAVVFAVLLLLWLVFSPMIASGSTSGGGGLIDISQIF